MQERCGCNLCLTDSGREGEYIFRLVYQQSGSKTPVKRVWISSQTEDAVKKGIEESKGIHEYDSLAKAAYCRAKEDWLFGMNFSRIYTCQYGRKLSGLLKEDSLIITMEKAGKYIENEELREQIKTCGIGTSATRAGIIKKLVDIGHIKINNKSQIVTPEPKGEAIVELVRLTAKELLNPILTASWEKGLFMIENHDITAEVFEEKLTKYITKTIKKVKGTAYGQQVNLTSIDINADL